jgi:Lipoprotein LpqB beta-propeller domain/Sporulation and spore germination
VASAAPRPARRRLSFARSLPFARRACVLVAAALSVAGCVSMPSSGAVGVISATPQSTSGDGNVIEQLPAGPYGNQGPAEIVQGFLTASASYPANASIAREYLLGSVSRGWSPGWSVTVFSKFNPYQQVVSARTVHGVQMATVDVSGDVQSTFNGSGQIVSAGSQGGTAGSYQFSLTKVNGQWRISKPPPARRLLTVQQFADFYRSQNLYFTNSFVLPAQPDQPLVPDSVFVPVGTPTTDLVTNLVKALLPTTPDGEPQSALLQKAAGTFPAGTSLISVAQTGSTAIVNLGGLTKASTAVKEQVSAQLAWTLATPRAGPPAEGAVQSVELELNGKPWIPPKSICGIRQARSLVQNQATYACYNPYPSQPVNFSFVSHGQVWSRCASEATVQHGLVGPVVSVLHPASAAELACDGGAPVLTKSLTTPAPVQVPNIGTPTLAAVSPDGQYVAVYSPGNPDNRELSIGPVGSTKLNYVANIGSGVTALSWDRNDELWVAENGDVLTVSVTGQAVPASSVPADVTDLSVAPDGVRIAFIVQDESTSLVDIGAIIRGNGTPQAQHGSPSEGLSIGLPVQVGPGLVQARSLAWYDADDLIVLAGASSPALWVVPVDGQASSISQPAPIGTDSITADGDANALVAGISSGGGTLAVSTGIEGPWQPLGVPGQNPAYPG